MSQKTDNQVAEVARWFLYHKGMIPPENLKARCEFLEKACHNLLNLCIAQAEDIQELEGFRRKLYLPTSVRMTGDGVELRRG